MHAYFSMSSTLRHCAAASGHLVQPAALPRMHHCFSGSTRKATGHFSISAQSCAPCLPPVSAERISNSQQSAALATSRRSAVVTAAKEGKAEPSVPAVDKARANGSPSNGEDGESCIIADIRTENDEHPELSVLSMEVPDFPGQFRCVGLNGPPLPCPCPMRSHMLSRSDYVIGVEGDCQVHPRTVDVPYFSIRALGQHLVLCPGPQDEMA